MTISRRSRLLVLLAAVGLGLSLLSMRRPAPRPETSAPAATVSLPTRGHGGRVTDVNGRPLAGARVEVVFVAENDPPRVVASATTNDAGVYTIVAERPPGATGVVLLRASAAGHATDGRVVEPDRIRQDFALAIGRSRATVHVVDESGAAVPGAEVVVSIERASAGPSAVVVLAATSDAHGLASFEDLPADHAEIHWSAVARGVGAAFGTAPVASTGDSRAIEARLDGGELVTGVAVDARGRPAPQAVLHLSETEGPWAEDATTDARGAFEVRHAPRRPLELRATGDWLLASGDAVRIEPKEDAPTATVRVVLVPALRIEGRVRTAAGDGVEGAEVIARAAVDPMHESRSIGPIVAVTDRSGGFVVRGLGAATTWNLEARRSELAPAFEAGVKAGAKHVDLVLHAGGTLRGEVRDDQDRGVPDVEVYVHRMSVGEEGRARTATREYAFVRTDAEGRYRAEHMNPGEYRVEARAAVMAWSDDKHRVLRATVSEGATTDVAPAKIARSGAVRGHVVVEEGSSPPAALSLSLLPEGSGGAPHRRAVACGPSGVFLVSDLEPGRYALTIHDAQRGFVTAPSVVVDPARTTNVDFSWGPRVTASGVVLDHDGRPVAGARVDAFRGAGRGEANHGRPGRAADDFTGNAGETDASGAFSLRGLEAGSYRVRVSKPGLPPAIADVTVPSDRALTINLSAPAKLVVHLDADRRVRSDKVILVETTSGAGFVAEAVTDADGVARFEGLPEGRYRVRGIVPGAKDTDVTVTAGETKNAHVSLGAKEES